MHLFRWSQWQNSENLRESIKDFSRLYENIMVTFLVRFSEKFSWYSIYFLNISLEFPDYFPVIIG